MKQKLRVIEKEVDYLVNPKPRFVSLVDHGANQTPWAMLKRQSKGERAMKPKIKLIKMQKSTKLAGTRKLVLEKTYFPTEDDVKKYLTDNNWEDFAITEKNTVFEAAGADVTDAQFKNIKKVSMEDGVVGYVGEFIGDKTNATVIDPTAKAAKPADEPAEPAKKTADPEKKSEAVQKFDCWSAMLSNENSLKGVLEDGMSDGIPPGMDEIFMSVYVSMSNVLKSDQPMDAKNPLIMKIGQDFAEVVSKVAQVYNDLIASEEADDLVANNEKVKKFVEKYKTGLEAKQIDLNKSALATSSVKFEIPAEISDSLANICKMVKDMSEVVTPLSGLGESVKKMATDLDDFKKKSPVKKGSQVDEPEPVVAKKVDDTLEKRLQSDRLGLFAGIM